jgi:SulP family sulfate permease
MSNLLKFFDLDKPIAWRTEILAGLAVAMTMIPESLSFAILAGFPLLLRGWLRLCLAGAQG